MADSLHCGDTTTHDMHGWAETVPGAPLGAHFHVCGGVGANEDTDREDGSER